MLVNIKLDSYEEERKEAKDSEYGLAASLFSDNLEIIGDFLNNIESGMAHVNHGTATDSAMPFGGVKGSSLDPFSKSATNKDFYTNYKAN